jgi:hypothetical protein
VVSKPSLHAAGAYFVYGVVYMIGAIAELDETRRTSFFGGHVPWWAFYAIGSIFLVVFPLLLAKGVRWLAAILAFFTGIKALYLFYRVGRELQLFDLFFALVALFATVMLLRSLRAPRKV